MFALPALLPYVVGVTPATLYVGTGVTADTANRVTYTFNSVDIGSAAASRYVVIAVAALSQTITSATIAGAAADLIDQGGAGGNSATCGLIGASVASGTTATVTVTFNTTNNDCGIQPYALYGLSSTTPFHTNKNSATATSVATTLNIPANGVAIVVVNGGNNAVDQTLTGLTEDVEFSFDSNLVRIQTGSSQSMSAETGRTITNTGTTSPLRRIVAASWA